MRVCLCTWLRKPIEILTNCKVARLTYSSGGHDCFLQWNIFAPTMSTNGIYLSTRLVKIVPISVESKLNHKQSKFLSHRQTSSQKFVCVCVVQRTHKHTHVRLDHPQVPSALIKRLDITSNPQTLALIL